MGMCLVGVRKYYVDVGGNILPCERVPEHYVIGNVNQGGIRSELCEELLKRIVAVFNNRCAECVFCRMCNGCVGSYGDTHGQMSEESFNKYCTRQLQDCSSRVLQYVEDLERNPGCFDYMEGISLS